MRKTPKQQKILLHRRLRAYNLWLQRSAALGDATHKHFCAAENDQSSPSKYLGLPQGNRLQPEWHRWSIISREIQGDWEQNDFPPWQGAHSSLQEQKASVT